MYELCHRCSPKTPNKHAFHKIAAKEPTISLSDDQFDRRITHFDDLICEMPATFRMKFKLQSAMSAWMGAQISPLTHPSRTLHSRPATTYDPMSQFRDRPSVAV